MPDNPTKDWIHFTSWLLAFTGGVIAAMVALYNVIEKRNQRKKELRWRQASAAKNILGELVTNAQAWNAALMMDSTDEDREYEIESNQILRISYGDVLCALKNKDDGRPGCKQRLIRDSFRLLLLFC